MDQKGETAGQETVHVRSLQAIGQANGEATLQGAIGKGEALRDSYELFLADNQYDLTLGYTIVYPGCTTRGHSHDDLEEIYFFTGGQGEIVLGETTEEVSQGSGVRIPYGSFHQVRNSGVEPLTYSWVICRRRMR